MLASSRYGRRFSRHSAVVQVFHDKSAPVLTKPLAVERETSVEPGRIGFGSCHQEHMCLMFLSSRFRGFRLFLHMNMFKMIASFQADDFRACL